MIWKNKHINIGEVKVGKKKMITFNGLENLPEIRSMTSTCGCSAPKIEGNNIVVIFVAPSIPLNKITIGYDNIIKQVKIIYRDGTQDTLSFSAKIIKN